MIDWGRIAHAAIECVAFSGIGLATLLIAYLAIEKVTPFSITKEIEEDQNTAVGIVLGAIIIAIGLIISAAIHG